MDGRDMPLTSRAPSLSFRNPRTGQSDRLSDRVQALTSWAAEMEEKSTGITEATAEKSRLSSTHVWSYLNPRSGIYRSPVTSLQDMSEHVEAGPLRDFVGPLGDMFPNDTIVRPQRHCAETWREAMSVNKSWPTQKAEDTGMVSFWHAMLAASRKMRTAFTALKTLIRCHKLKLWMLEDVTLAAGQLTNTLGLSLEFDHTRNLKKISEPDKMWFNFEGQKHRQDQLLTKIWVVVRRLEKCFQDRQCSEEAMEEICDAYMKFHVYLTITAKVVLEDALYFYRQHLDEKQFSCVCHQKYSDSAAMDPNMYRTALAFIVAATPAHCRSTRLKAMGYSWLESRHVIVFGLIRNRIHFQKPLDTVISVASYHTKEIARRSSSLT